MSEPRVIPRSETFRWVPLWPVANPYLTQSWMQTAFVCYVWSN